MKRAVAKTIPNIVPRVMLATFAPEEDDELLAGSGVEVEVEVEIEVDGWFDA